MSERGHHGPPGMTEAAMELGHKGAKESMRVVSGAIEVILAPVFIGLLNRNPQQPESDGHGHH